MTNVERIIKYLSGQQDQAFCDDCLSSLLKIKPRQAVNQACNKLNLKGNITRRKSTCSSCSDFKLVNTIGDYKPSEELVTSGTIMTGSAFENVVKTVLKIEDGIDLKSSYSIELGVGKIKKNHQFDLGNDDPPILVECKAHKWTEGGNVPSAKMTIWNEAMYYFAVAPAIYRKIFFVLKDERRGETLVDYYVRNYRHMIPKKVEIWEYDPKSKAGKCVFLDQRDAAGDLTCNGNIIGTVTARQCESCGHHEIGITSEAGEYVQIKPGMQIQIKA
jgi:hypothetical protein